MFFLAYFVVAFLVILLILIADALSEYLIGIKESRSGINPPSTFIGPRYRRWIYMQGHRKGSNKKE